MHRILTASPRDWARAKFQPKQPRQIWPPLTLQLLGQSQIASSKMQNVIRKTALARNQAQRKVIRAEKVARRKEAKSALMQRFAFDRQELDNIRAQKKNAREDWLRGPLAPRRDVGVDGRTYGAFAPHTMNPPAIPKHLRRKFFNFVPGDRVCVIRGREKGNIDTITEVNHENETVTLKNTNIVRSASTAIFCISTVF